jgi:hypothetical protein
MSKGAVAAAIVSGAVAVTHVASAQQPGGSSAPQGRSAAIEGQVVTAAATVRKVDKANSVLTLRDRRGFTFDVKAGPGVDLDRIHVGDRVTATYYQEVALAIEKAAQGQPTTAERTSEHGGVTARQATVTARIVSVDAKRNIVVIVAADGSMHLLRVDDPALRARLPQIRSGDAFDVTYTQAVALLVEPRK